MSKEKRIILGKVLLSDKYKIETEPFIFYMDLNNILKKLSFQLDKIFPRKNINTNKKFNAGYSEAALFVTKEQDFRIGEIPLPIDIYANKFGVPALGKLFINWKE